MPKAQKPKSSTPKKKSESGLTGGPSTIRGVTYQIDHAVNLLLEQIATALADPFTPRLIATEPRTTLPTIVRWDIRIDPPETTFEAKFNPKREELIDWLKLVARSAVGAPERRFHFVYAEERSAAKLIQTVRALARIAIEVGGDSEEFDETVAYEEVKGADEVMTILGENATNLLQRIVLEQHSENSLDSDIRLRIRYLASPEQAVGLRNYLFEKLQREAPSRANFDVSDIIAELRGMGFTLNQPQRIDRGALSPNALEALSALEGCKVGLPVEVLTAVTSMTPGDLETELASIHQVSSEDGLWSLAPLGASLAHPDETALHARVLEETLSYVKTHGKTALAQRQVPNVIALAIACSDTHPRLVATVFGALDKLLKEMGKKHLVREVAQLSKSAAQRAGVDREMKLAMIRSLICGLTWYYQRVGDLEEANVAAAKSYRFAEEIDSKIDLAFTAKCTGRLRRLEAEAMASSSERQSKLSESVGLLMSAIRHFDDAGGHEAEVGDCYSLMARTYLVMGDLREARNTLGRALARIPDDGGKDRLDALILAGDIEDVADNADEALLRYDIVVSKAQSPGREVTEMRARALRQRGRVHRRIGKIERAKTDFKEATRIWTELNEPNFAAEVEFELLDLSVGISELPRSMLLEEPAAVRVQAMNLHMSNLAEHELRNTRAAGRRAEPPTKYWKELIKSAHELVGFEGA